MSELIRLTQTVKKGGCAAKLPAGELRSLLASLKLAKPPELHVGTENLDDACLWDLGDGRYLVQTVDFFTPIVDDAYDFGCIAAANALSDVYAMGGEPRLALSVLAFPASSLPMELLEPLMRGAVEKIQEAGACLAGGHSIDDETLKLGFNVTGFVSQSDAWTNAGARPGDALLLTKALGTGTLTSALKVDELPPEHLPPLLASMKQLNRAPTPLARAGIRVHAATDVTGFGLAGHALQMARASGVRFRFATASLPALPGALALLAEECLNRAHRTNETYVKSETYWQDSTVTPAQRWLTLDPQTSGGLLLALPEADAKRAVSALAEAGFHTTAIVGHVEDFTVQSGQSHRLVFE